MRSATVRAAVVVAAALACGCTSQDERAYYQTRYLPVEGGEALYSSNARAAWSGDPEVYQLPSQAPSLAEHRARIECEEPGAKFKPETMAGYHPEVRGNSEQPAYGIGGFDSRPVPVSPLGPDRALPVGGQRDEDHGDALVRRPQTAVGANDPRPYLRRGAGVDTWDDGQLGKMRDADKWDYCLDPMLPPEKTGPAKPSTPR